VEKPPNERSSESRDGSIRDRTPSFLSVALRLSVVRRATGYAIVVGAILIAINHGDALLSGQISNGQILKMLLTICVPYCVSTASSVGAIRSRAD
jgi:hypothetical protein